MNKKLEMKSAKSTIQLVKGEDILKSIRHYMGSNTEGGRTNHFDWSLVAL